MIPHPAIPANPSLWSLGRILDNARRWLDHADTQEDYCELEDFISELEVRLSQMNETTDYLTRCLEATR
jgi:hypothetical protein